jgi:hypothetical protein
VRSTCHHEAYTFPRKRGFDRVKGGERTWNGWYRILIEPVGTRVVHLGQPRRLAVLNAGSIGWGGLTWIGRLALARKDVDRATAGVGSRLPSRSIDI